METTYYMYAILGTSFLTGVAGNIHCVSMCGPLWSAWLKQRSMVEKWIYHLSRISIYAIMGMIVGYTGRGVEWLKYGYVFSIMMGIGWLIILFIPFSFHFGHIYAPSKYFHVFQTRSKWVNMLLKGCGNALLPCGLLYAALTQGFISGSGWLGALALATFGSGTLLSAFVFSGLLDALISRHKLARWNIQKVLSGLAAILLILRGLNLGIPYISPTWTQDQEGKGKTECCHKPAGKK